MRIADKLGKPISETAYLTAENVTRYRAILRFFYLQHERIRYWLDQDEVYEEMKRYEEFAEYTPEQCRQDLNALENWKNLIAMQDTKKITSVEAFKNRKYRYQLSEYAVEIERLTIRLENLSVEGASLEPSLLERIKEQIFDMVTIAEEPPAKVYAWWDNLQNDLNKKLFRYLLYGICSVLQIDYNSQSAEDRAEILYFAGILKDDISSYVTCYGIRGICENGTLHAGMEGYVKQRELQQLTLSNLSNLKGVLTPNKRVYVVENPAVFRYLIEQGSFRDEAVVCGNGHLRIAVLILLDMLIKANATIFYAGDYDPEGLLIAQKIIDRYGKNVYLWCYTRENFIAASVETETIAPARLKKFQHLTDPRLKEVARWIMEDQKLGYQENILDHYLLDKPAQTVSCEQ